MQNKNIDSDFPFLYSTVRIDANGEGFSADGTGFYFCFGHSEHGDLIGVVTNRHVFEDVEEATFRIILQDADGRFDDQNPLVKTIKELKNKIIYHPDPEVDLCTIPVSLIVDTEKDIPQGKKLYFHPYSVEHLLRADEMEAISAIEDVIMIGYPNGIMDDYNNKPIIRKGITATHLKYDYDNNKEFLIDIFCFAGSSGSPVCLYKNGFYEDGNDTIFGIQTRLIGIMSGGYEATIDGKIVRVNISKKTISRFKMSINLGGVIKAERLSDLGAILMKKMD